MKVLALDVGDKRTGLAVGVTESKLALPFGLVEAEVFEDWAEQVKKVVVDEQIDLVLVGDPKTLSGGSSSQTKKSQDWGNRLQTLINVKVEFFDERLTSKQADGVLDKSTRSRDEIAAMYLLQDYLNSRNLA